MVAQLGRHKALPLPRIIEMIHEKHEKSEKHEYFKVFFASFAKFANFALKRERISFFLEDLVFQNQSLLSNKSEITTIEVLIHP